MVVLRRGIKFPYYFINEIDDIEESTFKDIIKALRSEMSYDFQNAEKVPSFQKGTWSGKICMLNRAKNGSFYFPVGLLGIVKEVFGAYEIPVKVHDESGLDDFGDLFQWKSTKILHDYQEAAIDAVLEDISDGGTGGLICLPTGSGKSLILCRLIFLLQQPTLILVPSKMLMYQWKDVLKEELGVDSAIFGDGKKTSPSQVTVAIVNSVFNEIKSGKLDFYEYNTVIFDEAHRVGSDTIYQIMMRCSGHARIGTTATPNREDGADVKVFGALGKIVYQMSPVELIERGILARPEFRFLDIPCGIIRARRWDHVRMGGIIASPIRNSILVEEIEKLLQEGHANIFVSVDILDHGQIFDEMLKERGISSYFLQGSEKSKERKKILKKFESGEINVLVSTLLKEGVDLPYLSVFINAGGGKSQVAQIQRVGRALRKKEDNFAVIVDCKDTSHKFLADHWECRFLNYKTFYGRFVPDICR